MLSSGSSAHCCRQELYEKHIKDLFFLKDKATHTVLIHRPVVHSGLTLG